MRAFCCVVLSFFAVGLAVGAAADHHEKSLIQEVEALGDAATKAMLENDVDAMLSFYVEDAISLPNFAPRMDGVAAFRKQHEQMTAAGMKLHSFDSTPTEAWECGNQVIEIGNYTIKLTVPGMPEPVEDKGKYLTVYERQADGSLKIKAETWNTDMNPMEMGSHGHE